jgi:hypothetical protein
MNDCPQRRKPQRRRKTGSLKPLFNTPKSLIRKLFLHYNCL